ncbi:MAG: Zn-dependent hydrolase [Acidobacteria bacterium]|nr:Zn-dependent hydrolase [Acidobacteriota bacterium]
MIHTRREFLATAGRASATATIAAPALGVLGALHVRADEVARIDAARLRADIEALSVFGRPPGGTFADGVSRTAYSDADVAGRRFVMDLLREAGLTPRIDAAGNIFAQRAGREAALPPILFGSHIDSVPEGGNFDGALGSLAGIEAVRTLNRRGTTTRHPLEVVVWAHEEGGTFPNGLNGSRVAAGRLIEGDLEHVYKGLKKADGIRRIGGDPDRLADARRAPGSFHCYLELHIEQGATLDRKRLPIGVVEGVVAISRYEARVRGFANHAGTTAMPDRQDALVAASQLVLAVREIVTSEEGRQVGTVGRLDVSPNATNVVPGEVVAAIELRDLSADKLVRLGKAIEDRAARIARDTNTTIEVKPVGGYAGADATPGVQAAIERAAESLGLECLRMPSGAGHDAQMMATLGPMGMIFVPSIGGVSHSPKELTTWEDCANGADVLLRSVLEVDAMAELK